MADEQRRRRALAELRPYIERARRFSGWDFSELKVRDLEPRPPWDYEALAREYAGRAARVLDLGTGGGEVLSRIAAGLPGRFAATEEWHVNAPVARARAVVAFRANLVAHSVEPLGRQSTLGAVCTR